VAALRRALAAMPRLRKSNQPMHPTSTKRRKKWISKLSLKRRRK
jgi:hypothetical protein